jgi:hypothetical protein
MIEELVDEFFMAPHQPATSHQEWLLRAYAQLMEREASVVSIAEAAQKKERGWKRRSHDSARSTEPSTEMDTAL